MSEQSTLLYDGSRCAACNTEFGFFSGGVECVKTVGGCGKMYCKACMSYAVQPESTNEVHTFCKLCFQRNSNLDFSVNFEEIQADKPSAIIWVHGAAGCRNMFREHAERVSAEIGCRSVLIDLPGHGARMDEILTVDSAIAVIHSTVQKCISESGGKKPMYVGGSLGGYLGMEYVGIYPDTLSGAVICMAGQDVGPHRGCAASMGLCCFQCMIPRLSEATLLNSLLEQVKNNGHVSAERVKHMSLRAGMFFHQGLAHVDVLLASDPRKSLPKFKQPMLFVNGTLDHRDSEQIWKSLAGGSSELIDYEGGDHFFSHDDRFMDRFIQELTTFAKKVLQ